MNPFSLAAVARSAVVRVRRSIRHPRPPAPAPRDTGYTVKLITDTHELRDVLRLRYQVFNLELHEGLAASHSTGHDFDPFDSVVDHLIVRHNPTGEIIGTYRLQTGTMAARHIGYYSQQEFDFTPYERIRRQVLELGRACIHQQHRKTGVLMLLWKAIAQYATRHGCRYLVGCSSLNSQDPVVGARVFSQLHDHLAPAHLLTTPRPEYAFPLTDAETSEQAKVPKLLRAYLAVGAQVCGPPALDREFRTIDFLTLLDLGRLPRGARARFLGE